MKLRNKVLLGLISLILIIGMICGLFLAYRLYKHERAQNQQISELLGQVEYLDERLTQSVEYYDFQPEYSTETYNYFAIGNSLTLIKSWGRGICSTEPDNDYFNIVKSSKKITRESTWGSGCLSI
ncbi:hypothetical protein [Butyrivibrio sp. FC2001]|uniref:hypothetical protein n=1 Tax=Butyrivibrio sp. FC2001 TaxID=1280671 RepID=UPI000479C695|nr:hypothetical protein [Butyrivibrio sp. FC2001]